MVGSLSFGKFLLMIFETAGSFSPTTCAMSFCQSSTFINIFYQFTCASFRFFEVPAV